MGGVRESLWSPPTMVRLSRAVPFAPFTMSATSAVPAVHDGRGGGFLAVHEDGEGDRAEALPLVIDADHGREARRAAIQVHVELAVGVRADAVRIDHAAEGQRIVVHRAARARPGPV